MMLKVLVNSLKYLYRSIHTSLTKLLVTAILVVAYSCLLISPALANIDDDKYDGNVFVLYAGNGSLVPARISLADSLKTKKPSLIVFYIDDSSDCKKYSGVISQLQAYYGKAASFVPVTVDSLDIDRKYANTEEGYYYKGKVRLDESGQLSFEKIDDSFREVFNLLPRSESVVLKKRIFNEYNSELTQ
jgi:hypothetical protein